MTNISQNGPGGACVRMWCKKKEQVRPSPGRLCLQPLDKQTEQTRASCYLMIPGLSSKTHNTRNVEHQETNPYI